MKFTGLSLTLVLTGMVHGAAIPAIPGADGAVGHLKTQLQAIKPNIEGVTGSSGEGSGVGSPLGTADGTVAHTLGGVKRQLSVAQPITEGVASSLNGATGIVGSAVGTAESTGQGAAGTAESTVAGAAHVKRQLDVARPITEGVASSLNGGTGIVGSAVGTAEITGQGAVGTAESTVAGAAHVKRQLDVARPITEGIASSLNGGTGIIGSAVGTAESTGSGAVGTVESTVAGVGPAAKRQLGNLPATASQTGTDLFAGLSGNPSGIYGALANLQMLVKAGEISPSDISNLPAAVQRVIANLAVA